MKIAVLASGSGTILKAMIEQQVPIEIVFTDKPCTAMDIACDGEIPAVTLYRTDFGWRPDCKNVWDREGFSRMLAEILNDFKIDLVAMAGFMTFLDPCFFEVFNGEILNIHPSLLPLFKGEHAVRDALAAGVKFTGSTVHIATTELDDERYILRQIEVAVEEGDTEETLHERIKVQERIYYAQVILDILSGKIDLNQIRQAA